MMEWISVKDRLPDSGRRVFVTTQSLDRFDVMIAHYDPVTQAWTKPIKPSRVIAWMELPEPYKSNKTGELRGLE